MIYLVEDDVSIRDLMIYALGASGLPAKGFSSSPELWEALPCEMPKLIILDIMLPGEDGISILKKLRANPATSAVPVIMATAKATEYDKVTGLDLGADDYLAKPFGMMEMVSRVRAVLRRASPEATKSLSAGAVSMNLAEHTVTACGERVTLTLKEYELLRLFLENPGMVFTREHLMNSVWGNDFFGETRTVDVHIGTLRTKLGACGDYIQTVRGVGYRMEAK